MSGKYNDRYVGNLYAEDYPIHYDVCPMQKNYSEEEDSYVRILENSIVHPIIDDMDEMEIEKAIDNYCNR